MPTLCAVLFDLDDTLTDRSRCIERFAPEFARRFKLDRPEIPLDQIVKCIQAGDGNGYTLRQQLCEHLRNNLPWSDPPDVEELASFWRERFPACNVEREGATPLLRELHGRGLKLGVITNGSPTQHIKLDVLGIRPLLSVVLVSDDLGIKKPDPRIFRMAMEKLDVLSAEVIFVGDNPELDIAGALGVGIRPIWLKCRDEPAPVGVEYITSLRELIPLLPA